MINKNENITKEIISIMTSSLPEKETEQKFSQLTQKEMSSEFFYNILPALFQEFKKMSYSEVERTLDRIIVNSLLCGFEISAKEPEKTAIKAEVVKEYVNSIKEKNDLVPEKLNMHVKSIIDSVSGIKFMFSLNEDTNNIYSERKGELLKVSNSVRGNNLDLSPEEYSVSAALIKEAALKLKDDESEQQRMSELAIKRLINSNSLSPMYIILMRRLINIADADLLTNEKMISNTINACIINNIEVVSLENIPKYEKEVFAQYKEKLLKNHAPEDVQDHLDKIKDIMNFKTITNEQAKSLYEKIELDKRENLPKINIKNSQKLN